ncbi:MAG: endonuclease, partial [Nocardioidaceae bacterium]|nr:endonuclease [Nocardioidaceae bacterium]
MPEGDTVWLHAQRLNRVLAGRHLTASDLRLPRLATTNLAGCELRDVTSRGKHLLIHLQAPDGREWTLHSHLRMDGTWRV